MLIVNLPWSCQGGITPTVIIIIVVWIPGFNDQDFEKNCARSIFPDKGVFYKDQKFEPDFHSYFLKRFIIVSNKIQILFIQYILLL